MVSNPFSDYQTVSNSDSRFGMNFPFSFGHSAAANLVVLGRLHWRPLQMCLLSVWRPHILPLDHKFWWPIWSSFIWNGGWKPVASFRECSSILQIPMHSFSGCQPLWKGSSSQTNETFLSWSLDGSQRPAPYQYSRNNGHSFCTEESHTIHTPLLCHECYWQYNSGIVCTVDPIHRSLLFCEIHYIPNRPWLPKIP